MNLAKAVRAVVDPVVEKLGDLSYTGYTRIEHDGFPQSTQLDGYSCGLQCAAMAIQYFTEKKLSFSTLRRKLHTTKEFGTQTADIVRVLRAYGLTVRRYKAGRGTTVAIRKAIAHDAVVLACVPSFQGDEVEHWVVIYGYTTSPRRLLMVRDPAVIRVLTGDVRVCSDWLTVRQ